MCVYLQGVNAVTWNPGKHYEMEGVNYCYSMTVTAAGEVVVWAWTQSGTQEVQAQWYDQQGKLIHTLPRPPQSEHSDLKLLTVNVGGKQQVALSCRESQCIWLGSRDAGDWSVAWQATGKEGSGEIEGQPKPYSLCKGKPGQIIVCNMQGDENSVVAFDIMKIPFQVDLVVPEIKLGMEARSFCYCELPGVGGALAVTDGYSGYKLCLFSLLSGAILWGVGGQQVKVAGAKWEPRGVYSDNRGRLYVADGKYGSSRIIVLSAASGSVLQVVKGRGHWADDPQALNGWVSDPGVTVYGADIKYKNDEPEKGVVSGSVMQEFKHQHLGEPETLCWHEQSKSIVVYHHVGSQSTEKHCITYFHIKF